MFDLADDDELDPEDAAETVAERASRQRHLGDPSRTWHLLQTEWALRTPVRSFALQAAQLDHITEVSTYPNVHLGVIPLDTVIASRAR